MLQAHTPELHQWIADQLWSSVAPEALIERLSRSGFDSTAAAAAVGLHLWAKTQRDLGFHRSAVLASMASTGWSAIVADTVIGSVFSKSCQTVERHMKKLTMRPFDAKKHSVLDIEVDEDAITARSGGFGRVCPIEGNARFLAKRLALRQPTAAGIAKQHLRHVRLANEQLGAARTRASMDRSDFVRTRVTQYLDEILENSLSTHYNFELDENHDVTAIWFLLPNAAGKDLSEHFQDDRGSAPPPEKRIQYAEAFSRRMRTLRRPGFVHLDCTIDNVRLDKATERLVMIDLDGVGIESQTSQGADEWILEPATLGKQVRMVRVPPWYPQEGLKCSPNVGNYKFGERWVALDTVIRILSWGGLQSLSWLPADERTDISGRYAKIQSELEPLISAKAPDAEVRAAWVTAYRRETVDLARGHRDLPRYTVELARSRNYPTCIVYFANLALDALFDPRALSGRPDPRGENKRSLYDEFVAGLSGEFND